MPQTSVFLRLNWPSSNSSSESSHEISSVLSSSSCSSVENSALPRRAEADAAPAATPVRALSDSDSSQTPSMKNPLSEEKRSLSPELVPLSRSRSTPIVPWREREASPSADAPPKEEGPSSTDEKKTKKKMKVKFRGKDRVSKARRMERSLSASCASVSTSTDPEDFFYACVASNYDSATLPRSLKDSSSRIIVPTAYKETHTSSVKPDLSDAACDDIPYIYKREDTHKDPEPCQSICSAPSPTLFMRKLRDKALSTLTKKKPSTTTPSATTENVLPSLQPVDELIEEEGSIPDLISHCSPDRLVEHDLSDDVKDEGEDTESPPRTLKKTVTFLLPPEFCDSFISEGGESASGEYPPSGYAELDSSLMPPNGSDPYRNTPSPGLHGLPNDRYVRWRDPDLHEVIDFLSNPNNIVKANAAAYLQHLCYMDDATKQKTRILGGIPPLVALLSHDLPELHRNACGALRNLSYGRQNDENKRAIKDAGGLPTLVRLLRKTLDNEVKELVTGILWNLSSCEDLKQSILDEALGVLVSHVIIPCSGWDGGEVERDPNNDVWWSTVFKNASGIIRNISSAGEYARTKLRHCPGLVDSLFCVIKLAIQGNSHDNKSVENCVCILRNLSYRCQEVEDPNYDKNQPPSQSRATATVKGDNLGCFGGSRKKKEMVGGQLKDLNTGQRSTGPRGQPVRGMELLWQPELVVQPYLALLSDCSNPETLEAAAGAIQNLAACYWQPSIDVRAAVRKEKGLPILVELLRMEVDRVVCAVATALRNLAIDQRNKELIGKYAMRDLVQKLPSQNSHDTATSDETIAAVLATLNEVIKKNAEFSRSLLDAGGVDRLVYITRQRGRYSTRVIKFASQVLFSMWGHQELREVYKKSGWKEQDFVSKSVAARNASGGANSPTANNTLNRPMASQGGTRYEDRTIQRSNNQSKHLQYQRREEVPLADLGYGGDGGALGGVRIYGPSQGNPGEPVYAKVNRDKKRHKQYDSGGLYGPIADEWGEAPPAYSAITPNLFSSNYSEPHLVTSPSLADAANNNEIPDMGAGGPAGDSWV